MRKSILPVVFFILFSFTKVYSHVEHYKNLNFLKYGLYFNGKLIGEHTFKFKNKDGFLYVYGTGRFTVNKLGIQLFDFETESEEVFDKGKLIKYSSKTIQNEKEKFSNIKLKNNKLFIEGSSYKGEAERDLLVGTWWNHEIIKFSKQISPISGRILPQKVNFLGKKELILFDKKYQALKFSFLSDDNKPLKKKKINFNVWYDENTLLWLKMSYEKLGQWEYRLKKYAFY